MARLAIKKDVLRNLALKSKNQCAYPNCTEELITHDNVFIGQVCHIESAEEGGQRFNPNQTDEDRRSIENLILFCYKHHKITDDEKKFPPEKLKDIKESHEKKKIKGIDEDKVIKAIENLERTQSEISKKLHGFIDQGSDEKKNVEGYKIFSPGKGEVWLPEQNKLYKDNLSNGTYFEFMMKDDLLCLTQGFPDGAEAYYEITVEGRVKECRLPYPIKEYSVVIPDEMRVRTEVLKLPNGLIKEKNILKYGRNVTLLKDSRGKLLEADIQARFTLSQKDRTFKILSPSDT